MVSVIQPGAMNSSISPNSLLLDAWKTSPIKGSPSTFTQTGAFEHALIGKRKNSVEKSATSNDNSKYDSSLFLPSTMTYSNVPWSFIKSVDVQGLDSWLKSNPSEINTLHEESGLNLFHICAAKGLLEFCKKLLKAGADPNFASLKGCNSLHLAARHGRLEVIDLLLSRNLSVVNEVSADGWAALHEAVSNNKHLTIALLIERGANINQQIEGKQETPLMLAVKNNHLESIEALLTFDPDVNIQNASGLTAFSMVCGIGNLEVAQKLVSKRADLKITTNRGASCAHIASRYGHISILHFILSQNASIFDLKTDDNWTCLHEAADTNNGKVIDFLLQKTSLKIDAQTSTGNTALHLAAKKGRLESFSALCDNDSAKPNVHIVNKNKEKVEDLIAKYPNQQSSQKMKDCLKLHTSSAVKSSVKSSGSSSKKKVEFNQQPDVSKSVDIFLSYSWSDGEIVENIYTNLSNQRFHVWQDKQKIGPGDRLYDKLQEGIESCKVFVPCLSKNYLNSDNAKSEFHLANLWKKPIIPVILDLSLTKPWPPKSELAPLLAPLIYLPVVAKNGGLDYKELEKLYSKVCSIERDHSI